jgi:hypothetical protein
VSGSSRSRPTWLCGDVLLPPYADLGEDWFLDPQPGPLQRAPQTSSNGVLSNLVQQVRLKPHAKDLPDVLRCSPLRAGLARTAGVHPKTMRVPAALAITLAHGVIVAVAGWLPDNVAAVLAGTVYGPLWPASALGLPVFGSAPSGGWPGPSLLGWLVLAIFWFATWSLVLSLLGKLRS